MLRPGRRIIETATPRRPWARWWRPWGGAARASGNLLQVGSDGKLRVKEEGIVVAGEGDPCWCGCESPEDANGDVVASSIFCRCNGNPARYSRITASFTGISNCQGSFACDSEVCGTPMHHFEVDGTWVGGTFTLPFGGSSPGAVGWYIAVPFDDVVIKGYFSNGSKFIETNYLYVMVNELANTGFSPARLDVRVGLQQYPSTLCSGDAFLPDLYGYLFAAVRFAAGPADNLCLDGMHLSSFMAASRCSNYCLVDNGDAQTGSPGYGGSVFLAACG